MLKFSNISEIIRYFDLSLNRWIDRTNNVIIRYDGRVPIHDGLEANRFFVSRRDIFDFFILIEQDGSSFKIEQVDGDKAAILNYLAYCAFSPDVFEAHLG